jgi:endonuclease/exonuclease/phosphatase family metal-dependent hydrolase
MGISGYEILIMTTVTPFFLGIPAVRQLIVAQPGIFYWLSLTGLGAFLIETPEPRLFLVGAGVAFSCLAWAGTFWVERNNSGRLDAKISAFSLGLILSSIAKFANQTNNPVWPIMNSINGGWNKTGLVLAILAVLRSSRRTPTSSDFSALEQKRVGGSSTLAALGLGGLLFALHSLLSDSSTMITWVWEGFPIAGPIPAPHGAYTIAAMGVGFLVGLFRPAATTTWSSWATASAAAALFHNKAGWTGFYGALILTIYLMALVPAFITACTRYAPGRTFGLAFLFYNLMVLAHVWVVAYAFVPGGPLLRERTDLVMIFTMALLAIGVYTCQLSLPPTELSSKYSKAATPERRKLRSYSVYILTILQLLSVSIAYLRFPTFDYTPYHPQEKLLTAGIWTVHFALDNDMWSSERRMRDAIKELELDVVGLLESDLQRIIMGNRDMTQFLAEDLGMYADFGPGPNKHTWGAALLSKFPIVNSTHFLLPSPVGELAPAILATLDCYGELVDVLVFHSGQEEDVEDRRLQSLGIEQIMADSKRPLILLSYLVTKPKEGNYNTYVSEKSRMRDIDPSDWDRWCEYILYRGIKRVGYARVSRGTITDTEIQVGKFLVGQPEGGDVEIEEGAVEQGLRFPEQFKGEGVRGHAYHVFDRPRYVNPWREAIKLR